MRIPFTFVAFASFAYLASTACSAAAPQPEIASVTPKTGDYGTKITVSGRHLESLRVTAEGPNGEDVVLFTPPPVDPKKPVPEATSLQFPFAFPAEGTMKLGDVPLGEFMPTWKAGPSTSLGTATVRDAVWAGNRIVAVVSGATGQAFVVFDGGTPHTLATDVKTSFSDVALAVTGTKVTALFFDGTAIDQVILDGDVVTHAPFGALPAGTTPVTIGVDTAPFVVGRQGTNVVRLRSGATDAIVEGAPIPLPGTAPKGSGFGTALGGTIVYVWAEHRSPTIVDDTTAFFVAAVAAGEKAFSAGTSLGDYDDDFSSLTVQRVRGAVQAGYCAIQTGTFDNPKKNCGAMVTVDGRSPLSGYGVGATNVPAFAKSKTGVGIASCEGNTLDVGTDTNKEVALYPCLDPQALVFDDAGAPHLLTATGGRLYAASRR